MTLPTIFFTSKVISGHARGRLLGYPTLNLTIPPALSLEHGIYAGWVEIDSKLAKGAFHFGPIPTFQEQEPSLEVFVLDQSFSSPPEKISFQLTHFLRLIIAFPSQQSLIDQISLDVAQTKSLLTPPTC